ncbi:MAG TPA: GTPase [Pirellulales bacterium]|jgi:tRNA modification GTPase|nr:GTPase [Pirellulales bacterium]
MRAADRPSEADANLTAAVLTPPGRGAIATVLVAGARATATVAKLFSPATGEDFAAAPIGRILLGRWAQSGEELVVCRRGHDEIEVHCHGGETAVEAVLGSLADLGCQRVAWTGAVRRPMVDPIAAEARELLARATTLRTAAILLDQYHGALRQEFDECAALLDSSDEDSWRAAEHRLNVLSRRSVLGRHLVEPFQVVIAGKPNVGKSSLINALVGYQRSIVYQQPGTTRDVVSTRTAFAGWPVELSDTAGLRHGADPLEAAGIDLAIKRFAAADLRVAVFDASQLWDDDDEAFVAQWSDALVVYNKIDQARPAATRAQGIETSALTGLGIKDLTEAIGDRLVPDAPPAGAAIPFTPSHEYTIVKALEHAKAGDRCQAACLLRSLFSSLATDASFNR